MPKRQFFNVQLPYLQPDCCIDCPLLGIVPDNADRPKGSRKTRLCIGTMKALTEQSTHILASSKDKKHPLRRPCDTRWEAWMHLPGRKFGMSWKAYLTSRVPLEQMLPLKIDFSD